MTVNRDCVYNWFVIVQNMVGNLILVHTCADVYEMIGFVRILWAKLVQLYWKELYIFNT